jgi:N-acetylornithine carbamoyltransferase
MKHFIDLADLEPARLEAVLKLAKELEHNPRSLALKNRTVGLLFVNPSLRTLASMQAGVSQLGGDSFLIQPGAGSWKLEMRDGAIMDGDAVEHVKEAIPVLAEYADALAIRCFAEGKDLQAELEDRIMKKMAALCPKPFINLESAVSHPCQALADWKTMEDFNIPRAGGKFVLSWAYHPKPLPYAVPASALRMAAMRGMNVTVLRPEGFSLPQEIMTGAKALANASGGSIKETSDRREAMEGAHVLYVKSWAAPQFYTNHAKELELRAPYKEWCARESWFENAKKDARVMHCLPVRRNVKIADELLDGPRSIVVKQAGNRLHGQKALMAEMLGR